MKKKLKVLTLLDVESPMTLEQDLSLELQTPDWKTEAHVLAALAERGHTAHYLALYDDLDLLRQKLQLFEADVIFNLADQFKKNRAFDQNIVSYLEMHDIPFTGCGSVGLTLCKHKGISKKILSYHRIHVPGFALIPRGQKRVNSRGLRFPLLVKPLKEEASLGIAQASLVSNDEQFRERVQFVHEKIENDVIAEEYIEGRELYVSVLGNQRLQVFPIRELVFTKVPPDEPKIATYRAKWDEEYRQRWGLQNQFAEGLDPALVRKINDTCRRIYRLLAIDGYARLDLRVTAAGEVYFIEANPNPMLAADEDFSQSALKGGLEFPALVERIIRLGLQARRG